MKLYLPIFFHLAPKLPASSYFLLISKEQLLARCIETHFNTVPECLLSVGAVYHRKCKNEHTVASPL